MNDESNKELLAQIRALENTCRIWIAANRAKDERLGELETECNQLRHRVARLSRQVGRRQKIAAREETRATPRQSKA